MKLVSLETAKALRELGYDGPSDYIWIKSWLNDDYTLEPSVLVTIIGSNNPIYKAPRLDDAMYWLMDNYGIIFSIGWHRNEGNGPYEGDGDWYNCYYTYFHHPDLKHCSGMANNWSYEEAMEKGLEKVIEYIHKNEIHKL